MSSILFSVDNDLQRFYRQVIRENNNLTHSYLQSLPIHPATDHTLPTCITNENINLHFDNICLLLVYKQIMQNLKTITDKEHVHMINHVRSHTMARNSEKKDKLPHLSLSKSTSIQYPARNPITHGPITSPKPHVPQFKPGKNVKEIVRP